MFDALKNQTRFSTSDLDLLADERVRSRFVLGPARMADNFQIELPHPRTLDLKTHETFGVYTRRIYKLLGME